MTYAPGNQLAFNNLNVDFLIDESMIGWQEIYNWFLSFASPSGTTERQRLSDLQNPNGIKNKQYYSDATLTILSALNNPVVRINFTNIFPVSLADVNFDTKQSADDIILGNANFVYEQYQFQTT